MSEEEASSEESDEKPRNATDSIEGGCVVAAKINYLFKGDPGFARIVEVSVREGRFEEGTVPVEVGSKVVLSVRLFESANPVSITSQVLASSQDKEKETCFVAKFSLDGRTKSVLKLVLDKVRHRRDAKPCRHGLLPASS